ncbi:hypothetical protein LJC43_04700 [Parabacteroides sp. OttesenSCG-928-G21]|nr:hypothetical protein [Parabacteroides sp. OttesenSCG-928-G21]
MINDEAFKGQGTIHYISKKNINLYKDGENQIIFFLYATGHLTITWKYKYYQKETILEKDFDNVRNLSLFEQEKIANIMISEMRKQICKHKKEVLNNNNMDSTKNIKSINNNTNISKSSSKIDLVKNLPSLDINIDEIKKDYIF